MQNGAQVMGIVKQNPGVVDEHVVRAGNVTIATTGNSDQVVLLPTLPDGYRWKLKTAEFATGAQGLAANDTNYITFSVTNKSNSDAAMLAASDANTTKATGGSAVTAYTRRGLTLNSTAANLIVDSQDVLLLRAAATGTLGAQMPNSTWSLTFEQTVYKGVN